MKSPKLQVPCIHGPLLVKPDNMILIRIITGQMSNSNQGSLHWLLHWPASLLTIADPHIVVSNEVRLHPVVHLVESPGLGQLVASHLTGHPLQALLRTTLGQLKTWSAWFSRWCGDYLGNQVYQRETKFHCSHFQSRSRSWDWDTDSWLG